MHVRILLTYVFYRRTSCTDVRILLTYVFLMHVFYRRTYVFYGRIRDSATYVFGTTRLEIEISGLRIGESRFGTTRSEIEDSGLRFWRWIRDNAGSRVRRTFWMLDLVEEDRRELIFQALD